MEFSKQEERLLIRSGDRALTGRMKRSALTVSLLFCVLIAGAAAASGNVWIVLAVALAYIFVTMAEKIAYIRAIEKYKALIVKLSTRVNDLEKKG